MSELRRQRYQSLLYPLTRQLQFCRHEVDDLVEEKASGFVTRTLNEMVKAGVLQKTNAGRQSIYQWLDSDPVPAIDQWIQNRLNGDQVKQSPPEQRPRERLLDKGPQSLTNAELLAILIRVGIVGESAVTGGSKLANHFHDQLDQLRLGSLSDLRLISRAVTKASYCQIMAGIELGRRVAQAERDQPAEVIKITSTKEATEYCAFKFAYLAGDAVQEEFHIVTLDTKHKPLRTHRITVGTLDSSLVHPREVFRPAIRDAAAAVLLVHNHPSGDPTPSREDHAVTSRLTEAGKLIGITVLDHIVVARERCISLRECG